VHTGQKAVDQTLHLQQIIQLHKITNMSSPASGVSATVSKRPVRKQPEGLKMRFRPIGFGNGKTGTIGSSSSSSDASSSTDNDADEEIEDAPQVSRQPLAKANASQDDTSSSGEEMDDPPPAALADSPSDSDSSSEPSNNKREDLPKITSAPEISSNSPPRPLKRKLSDLKKDDKTSNTLCDQFKANGVPLKTTNIKKLSPALGQSVSKVNGNANTTTKQNILSTSPPKMTQVVLPPRVSETTSSPANGSNLKVTPVPPPRQSSILPPGRGTKSLDVPKVLKAAGARSKTSPVKVAAAKLPPEKNNQKSLEDHIQSIDPTLSEKEREKDIRRLRKKEASRISKNQRRESMNSATSDTLDRSINASSPSRNAQQHRFQAISAPKSSADKELSRDVKRNITTSMEKVSKKPKKHPSSSIIHNENGGTAKPSYGTSTTIPLPRKESVILPPKLNRSMSR
jgi:hypothetical protein